MFLFPSGFFVLVELNTIALIKIELKHKVFLLWTSDKDLCFRVCAKGSEVRRRRETIPVLSGKKTGEGLGTEYMFAKSGIPHLCYI